MINFERAFTHVVGVEGGYVNDPNDPGGKTKYGISKRAYPDEDIENLTINRAKEIYLRDYWNKCRCDELPSPLNLYVFDAAVNHGVGAAIGLLQAILGVKQDGMIGQITISTAERAGKECALLYLADRAIRYSRTAGFSRFGRGWMKRLFLMNEIGCFEESLSSIPGDNNGD